MSAVSACRPQDWSRLAQTGLCTTGTTNTRWPFARMCRRYGRAYLDYLDASWQAKAPQGFDGATFVVDWDAPTAPCPQGHQSVLWMPGQDRHGHDVINMRFARADCTACAVRAQCPHAPRQPRMLMRRARAQYEALHAARQRQTTAEFQHTYAARAGIEGTLSHGVRLGDLRRSRYLGLAKTHWQHLVVAAAMHLLRVAAWLADMLRAQTRRSPIQALAMASP